MEDDTRYHRLYRIRVGAAALAALMGLIALLGWGAGIPALTQIRPGLPPMTPSGAVFLVVAAIALAFDGVLARALATVLLLGGLVIAGANLAGGGTPSLLATNVSSPTVAANMILGGIALLARDARAPQAAWTTQICALLVVLNALRSLMGLVIGDDSVALVIHGVGMSPQGAFSVVVLGVGLLAACPGGGFMALLASERAAGRLFRWLVAVGVLLPIFAALISELAWRARLFGMGTTIGLFLLASLAIFYRTAASVDRIDRDRTLAEERLALVNTDLERRVAERTAALQNREAQISAIGDNLPGVMIYQTVAGNGPPISFTYVSAGVERISGLTPEQLITDGLKLYNQIAPEDRLRLAAAEADSAQALKPLDIEVRKLTPWGLRWSRIRSRPRQIHDGLVAWDGIEVDITAQKEVEAALERDRRYQAALFACSQALLRPAETAAERDAALYAALRHLLEGASADRVFLLRIVEDSERGLCLEIPVVISAPEIDGGASLANMVRIPMAQLPPWIRSHLDFPEPTIVNRAGLGPADERLAQILDEYSITSFVVLPLWPSRHQWGGIGFHACTGPREWDKQELLLLRTAAELISSTLMRWEDEDELRRREELLTALFDILPVGVVLVDGEQRPLRLNQAVSQIVGLDLPSIMAGAYEQIRYVHPDMRPVADAEYPASRAATGDLVRDMEVGVVRTDGQVRWTSMSAAPLPIPGLGAALVMVDITERKRAAEERLSFERKLLEAQRLESLGVLAGGVAHDFNNILTSIMGHADLARLDLPPNSEIGANLAAIVLGAQRASGLTAQMLAYAGRSRFLTEALDLNSLAHELGSLTHVALPGGVSVRYVLAPDLPPIIADATQVRQVLLNLLTNGAEAIAANGREGTLSIATRRCDLTPELLAGATFSEAHPGSYGCLEVSDNGHGMDAATLARIFDPFFSTRFTGRGLGLAAVQGIMRAHCGALFVRSAPGVGTTFRVCFPLAPAAPQDEAARGAGIA